MHVKSCSRVKMCCFVLYSMYISRLVSSHLGSYQRRVVHYTNVVMLLPRSVPRRLRRPLRSVHLHKSFVFDIPFASRFGNLEFHLLFICVCSRFSHICQCCTYFHNAWMRCCCNHLRLNLRERLCQWIVVFDLVLLVLRARIPGER